MLLTHRPTYLDMDHIQATPHYLDHAFGGSGVVQKRLLCMYVRLNLRLRELPMTMSTTTEGPGKHGSTMVVFLSITRGSTHPAYAAGIFTNRDCEAFSVSLAWTWINVGVWTETVLRADEILLVGR